MGGRQKGKEQSNNLIQLYDLNDDNVSPFIGYYDLKFFSFISFVFTAPCDYENHVVNK